MRTILLVSILVFVIACGRKAANTEAREAPTPAIEPGRAGTLLLEPEAQRNAGLEIQPVLAEQVNETISATGQLTVNEDQTWSVGSLMDGRVVSIAAKVGDRVAAGQVLARIHSHDVHDARAAFRTAQTELTRSESAESLAQRVRDRVLRLLELKAASQQELESAEGDLRNARSAVQNAQIALARERAHLVEFLEVPVNDNDSKRGDPDDFVPIKAPAAGIILERSVTPGSVVAAGDQAFRITSTSTLWMIANVNEADLARLRPGQPVRLQVRAFPDRLFTGRILRLGEQLDPATRTLQVRVLVPNPGNALKPAMYATAEIVRGESRQALFIPESAAQELNGVQVVFVRSARDRFEPRPIEVARTVNGRMEVTGGLHAGEEVVVKGSFVLKSELLKNSLREE